MLNGLAQVILIVVILALIAGVALSGAISNIEGLKPAQTKLTVEKEQARIKAEAARAELQLENDRRWIESVHTLIIPTLCICAILGVFYLVAAEFIKLSKQVKAGGGQGPAGGQQVRADGGQGPANAPNQPLPYTERYDESWPPTEGRYPEPPRRRGGNGTDTGQQRPRPPRTRPEQPGRTPSTNEGDVDEGMTADGGECPGVLVDWSVAYGSVRDTSS